MKQNDYENTMVKQTNSALQGFKSMWPKMPETSQQLLRQDTTHQCSEIRRTTFRGTATSRNAWTGWQEVAVLISSELY